MTDQETAEIDTLITKHLNRIFEKIPFAEHKTVESIHDAYNETISQLTGNPKPADDDGIGTFAAPQEV